MTNEGTGGVPPRLQAPLDAVYELLGGGERLATEGPGGIDHESADALGHLSRIVKVWGETTPLVRQAVAEIVCTPVEGLAPLSESGAMAFLVGPDGCSRMGLSRVDPPLTFGDAKHSTSDTMDFAEALVSSGALLSAAVIDDSNPRLLRTLTITGQ